MQRRTKIVATLGPSTDDPKVLDEMIQAGVDVVRLNFSHGSHEEHMQRAEAVRNRARAHGRQVGVLVDLQGPKIRIDRFKEGKVDLKEGEHFILDAAMDADSGNQERVGIAYKALVDDVNRGDTLLLDDGAVVLWVEEVKGNEIVRVSLSVASCPTTRASIARAVVFLRWQFPTRTASTSRWRRRCRQTTLPCPSRVMPATSTKRVSFCARPVGTAVSSPR